MITTVYDYQKKSFGRGLPAHLSYQSLLNMFSSHLLRKYLASTCLVTMET